MLGELVVQPVARAPVAHQVPDERHPTPDHPPKYHPELVEHGEFHGFAVDAEGVATREAPGHQQVQSRDRHEPDAGQAAERDLGFQNRQVDAAEPLLPEPEPVHQQVHAAREQRRDDKEQQKKTYY